ncbi:hypothetical protein M2137_002358 [Parabacteroides sp. PFB2-10]|nr:hypothetical protein [Parabacteroides sp. PFB2-10]
MEEVLHEVKEMGGWENGRMGIGKREKGEGRKELVISG